MTIGFVGLTLVHSDSPPWVLLGTDGHRAGMGTHMLSLLLACSMVSTAHGSASNSPQSVLAQHRRRDRRRGHGCDPRSG